MTRLIERIGQLFAPPSQPLSEDEWSALVTHVALVDGLEPSRRQRLRALVERFLADKTITPAADLELDAPMCHALAAMCCLPVLEFGYAGLRGWSQVIVYPGSFRARRSHVDELTGVVSEGDEDLAGEAWGAGPVVLSWDDIATGLETPCEGFNVAIHEIAHKLDLLDGTLDGCPPLPAAQRDAWSRDFQAAYCTLVRELEAGLEPVIDEYAASAPEEFFAVVSEYHFTAPEYLAEVMPDVARHLRAFYGAPPALTGPAESAH